MLEEFERDRHSAKRTAHGHSKANITIIDKSLNLMDMVNKSDCVDDACWNLLHVHSVSKG